MDLIRKRLAEDVLNKRSCKGNSFCVGPIGLPCGSDSK